MLFKRAGRIGLGERLRVALWPRRSWTRSARYVFLRLKRLPSSPHRIAVGAAAGVFAVFTPFLGAQMILATVLAIVMRGSIVASFLASFVGNPLTYPIIWFATYNLGNVLLGDTATGQLVDLRARFEVFGDSIVSGRPQAVLDALGTIWPILKPMAIGALPLGIIGASLAYVGIRRAIGSGPERPQFGGVPQIGG